MNYHNIVKDDMNNGDGIRVTLFVAGCEHHCKGCQNPQTWDKDSGIPFDSSAREELLAELAKPYIDGVTLSGGDPMALYNRHAILELCKEVKEKFPGKTIWIYTGYTLGDLEAEGRTYDKRPSVQIPGWEAFSKYVDVLVDGPFVEEKKSISYEWAGSTNQRVLRRESNFEVNTSDKTETLAWQEKYGNAVVGRHCVTCGASDIEYNDDYER